MEVVRQHRWTGAGMGSFVTAYTPHQSTPLDLITEHAHNDYIESLTETGVLGGLLTLTAVVLLILITARNLAHRPVGDRGWIQTGAAIGCYGLLIHSFVDFNLHIPANAAWFVFCAAIASLTYKKNPKSQPPSRNREYDDKWLQYLGNGDTPS